MSKLTTDVVTYCTEASNQKSKYAYQKIFFYKKALIPCKLIMSCRRKMPSLLNAKLINRFPFLANVLMFSVSLSSAVEVRLFEYLKHVANTILIGNAF